MARADLNKYCTETSALDTLFAFKQLSDSFKFVSALGNANPLYMKDWMPVLKPDPETYAAKAENWDEDTSTCSGTITGWAIKFITSSLGQPSNLQKYIVGVSLEPITSAMTFTIADAAKKQSFTHQLTVSFQDILTDKLRQSQLGEGQFFLPNLPDDLFYPFMLSY